MANQNTDGSLLQAKIDRLRNNPSYQNSQDDNGSWVKAPYGGFILGSPFENLADQLAYINEGYVDNTDLTLQKDGINKFMAEYNAQQELGAFPAVDDTAIGGIDYMNPLWQFNIDDDIVWPGQQIDNEGNGLGRVYTEMYDENARVLWLSFGTPKFISLSEYYAGAADSNIAAIMSNSNTTLTYKFMSLVGTGIRIAFTLPFYPLIGIYKTIKYVANKLSRIQVNKYYEMIPRPDLYYKVVDTILAHLSVGMNLYPDATSNDIPDALIQDRINHLPEILQSGPDILYILTTRQRRRREGNDKSMTSQKVVDDLNKNVYNLRSENEDDGNWLYALLNRSILKEHNYVGFRIERGTDFSETVSNNTGQAEIAQKLNGMTNAGREASFAVSHGNYGDNPVAKVAGMVRDTLVAAVKTVGDIANAGDAITIVSQGTGFFDVPDVWQGSSFSKSYSFDIQLRARYGDPLTIYQSIYIPLAMLMAGAFPIGTGKNMYTSPFLVQAFSKGLFSIPTGIIESMTIKRGLPEHGWTHDFLPTAVDVSISIKDMSPAMFLSLFDSNLLHLLDGNDSMKMYLGTLSGLSISELTNKKEGLYRRWRALWYINMNTLLSSRFWSIKFAGNKALRTAAALTRAKTWKTPDR
jgi:hypothetical protein